MNRIAFLLCCFLLPLAPALRAQDLPAGIEDVGFEAPAVYKAQHDNVVKVVDWLLAVPVDNAPQERQKANAYLLAFLTGSPDVTVNLGSVGVYPEAPALLMAFMGGWARHMIVNDAYGDMAGAKLAGARAVVTLYERNRATLPRIKAVEKMAKLDGKGKLADWLAKQE